MPLLEKQALLPIIGNAVLLFGLILAPQSGFGETGGHIALRPDELSFLNRLTWGGDSSDAQRLSQEGMARFLEEQLHPPADDGLPVPVEAEIASFTISQKPAQTLFAQQRQRGQEMKALSDQDQRRQLQRLSGTLSNAIVQEAAMRSLLRDVYSRNQLKEQLTWFWFNHFSVKFKPEIRPFLADYEERTIRPHVLGHFKDLLTAVVYDPAMLLYLNNAKNAAGHINENYAREFLELHTMGVDGGYSQKDVEELARIFTGLTIDRGAGAEHSRDGARMGDGRFLFDERRHDTGDKVFLSHTINGGGADEIDQVIDIVCHHPATAHYISRQLATYFVSDAPPEALVEAMAETFRKTDGDIAAVLRTMFDAAEFRSSLGTKFKDPVHFVVSAVRLAYGNETITNPAPMIDWLHRLGEQPYARETPDGYPMTADSWSGSGSMTQRFQIASLIASGKTGLFKPLRLQADTDMGAMEQAKEGQGADNAEDLRAPARLPELSYARLVTSALAPATLGALAKAKSPEEWYTLFLSSPEFMHR